MRSPVRFALMAACLSLTGCGLFGKRTNAQANGEKPFLGATPPARTESAPVAQAAATGTHSPVDGLLAGQVLDRFNRRLPGVWVQVLDLDDPRRGAPLDVEIDREGYFYFPKLKTGHHYQLIARTKDGERLLSGTTLARAPNPRVSIYLSDEYASPRTPAVPGPPSIPGQPPLPRPNKSSATDPSASLEAPVKTPAPAAPGPQPSTALPPGATAPVDPTRIADGFEHATTPPRVNVPGREANPPPRPSSEPTIPPPPRSAQDATPFPLPPTVPPAGEPPAGGASAVPSVPTPVPSCVLVGQRLDNFSLYGLDGQVWEYRKNHTGRLVLLDFWFSTCGPCLQALPHLVDLHRQYGSSGLEVVGIAYEKGTTEEQVRRVRQVRGRFAVSYTTLLGGGGTGPCPVKTQFEVSRFPTVVLLDEKGQIIWRSEGLDQGKLVELEAVIRRRLGVAAR